LKIFYHYISFDLEISKYRNQKYNLTNIEFRNIESLKIKLLIAKYPELVKK